MNNQKKSSNQRRKQQHSPQLTSPYASTWARCFLGSPRAEPEEENAGRLVAASLYGSMHWSSGCAQLSGQVSSAFSQLQQFAKSSISTLLACVTKLAVQLSRPSGSLTTHSWLAPRRPCSLFNLYHLHLAFYCGVFSSYALRGTISFLKAELMNASLAMSRIYI